MILEIHCRFCNAVGGTVVPPKARKQQFVPVLDENEKPRFQTNGEGEKIPMMRLERLDEVPDAVIKTDDIIDHRCDACAVEHGSFHVMEQLHKAVYADERDHDHFMKLMADSNYSIKEFPERLKGELQKDDRSVAAIDQFEKGEWHPLKNPDEINGGK